MFSNTLFLGLLISHHTFITATALPATNDNAQQPVGADIQIHNNSSQTATKALYTITAAHIHQYDGPPAASPNMKARQAASLSSGMNPPPLNSTGSNPTDPSPSSDSPMDAGLIAARPPLLEDFNLTVTSGASNAPSVHCNLTWDAGTANSGTRDHIASETFSCDDGKTNVRMERRNVTPLYGFYVFVQMPNAPVAAWMVKDLNSDENKKAGWVVNGSDATFTGMASLTNDAHQTLADFLEVPLQRT